MAKPVILTVDDEPEVLAAISRDLRNRYGKDYRVIRADSGQVGVEVLHQLQERGDPIALVISDQRMPKMAGVEFLEEVTALFSKTKRVLLTAYADTEAAIRAINSARIDYYLMKPWDPPEEKLYPVIDDLLLDWHASYRPGYEGLRVIGNRWSPQSFRIKDFLSRNQVPYEFLDVEVSEEAREIAARSNGDAANLPLVIFPDGKKLSAPGASEVAEHLGLQQQAKEDFYDLVIVGAGPAGLASAVYGASEGLRTVVVEREAPGGQAGTTSQIENYLGFPTGLSGGELARRGLAQTQKFGVEMLTPQEVVAVSLDGPYKKLKFSSGDELACHVLMISTGVSWRRPPAKGADSLIGSGVYYGAALTEAIQCAGEEVYMIGAGNSAGQAAMYFSKYARKVIMLIRGDSIAQKMSHYLVEQIEATENIEVRLHAEARECHGTGRLEGLTLIDNRTDETGEVSTHGLFIFIGAEPKTEWLEGIIARDEHGFILTGHNLDTPEHLKDWPLERDPYFFETNVPGIFAAGDVRHNSIKRIASAVGEGSMAVHFMHQYLASL